MHESMGLGMGMCFVEMGTVVTYMGMAWDGKKINGDGVGM